MAFVPKSVSEAIVNAELTNRAAEAISTNDKGFQYIDGTMTQNLISPILARCIAVGRIVRPGVGATEEFVNVIDIDKVLNVTVQLPNMIGVTTRTVGTNGTPGNSGLINRAKKIITSTTPFNIPLTQYNDQALFFPKLMVTMALYDVFVETLASYADSIIIAMDSYHISKAISYAGYRVGQEIKAQVEFGVAFANITESNIIRVDLSKVYEDNYMIKIWNELINKMAKGDPSRQALTFTGPREVTARIELINYLTTPKTGFVNNASDIGQKIVFEPNFDMNLATRQGSMLRVSSQAGKGFDLYEANQILFSHAEKWLGLTAGAFDKVLGVVFTPQAYAMGGAANAQTNIVQSSEYDGTVCFTYQKFGGTAYRKTFIIVESDFVMPEALQGVHVANGVKGVQTLTITNKGAATDTIKINGVTYTQVASGAVAAEAKFNVGTDTSETAASLSLALKANAALMAKFDVSVNAAVITFTQKTFLIDDTIPAIEIGTGDSLAATLATTVTRVAGSFTALSVAKSAVAPAEWGIVTYTDLEDTLNNGGSTFAVVNPGLGLPTT